MPMDNLFMKDALLELLQVIEEKLYVRTCKKEVVQFRVYGFLG